MKNGRHDSSSVGRWAGVHRSNHEFQLAFHTSCDSGVPHQNAQGSDSFSIQTMFHVLGIALGDEGFPCDKPANRERVGVQASAGEILIGAVEEGQLMLVISDVAGPHTPPE
ncbi:hypothetical protein MPTK1_7g02300 [Marchantia polymorpha subsp. ruderalis]|uniref:Uncharacterized protein n=2 Tax=Marchantia polymorpha TaxID=3197 RepID=A0AAF6BVC7_MARPO|nr:hypothetical protein MARPO_0088s0054 [Marchantia polymorpha]BBN15961.1 hypothetical protein Mp_7g02300 [Marchantia polymorpha subsp. ruderalis]|eukprot:PTQ33508.1 hypothetical protein MARPO_0088s0054 [Marchantia polymorpha]